MDFVLKEEARVSPSVTLSTADGVAQEGGASTSSSTLYLHEDGGAVAAAIFN